MHVRANARLAKTTRQAALPPGLFDSRLVLRNEQQIRLTPEQMRQIEWSQGQVKQTQDEANKAMHEGSQRLLQLLLQPRVDEGQARKHIQNVLDLEHRVRLEQLLNLIRIKNLLSADQQAQLTAIRDDPSRQGGESTNNSEAVK